MLADYLEDRPDPTGDRSTNGLKQWVESQLVSRIAAGDRWALRTLYEMYFPRLASFFGHLTTAPVEDLINSTLLDIWRHSGTFNPDGSIYAWIMRFALSHARQQPLADSARPAPDWKTAMLARLSIEDRAIMHLVYTGHTRAEVAEILGVSADCVDTLLTQARLSTAKEIFPRRDPAIGPKDAPRGWN